MATRGSGPSSPPLTAARPGRSRPVGSGPSALITAWIALSAGLMLAALYAVFFVAPSERTMGIAYKIFYFHVPTAIAMGALFVLCGVASLAYLVQPDRRLDAAGAASAEIAVLLGVVVLTTGPLWARKSWGTYWTFEPRLMLTLLTVFIYAGYLAVRAFGGAPESARRSAAVLGVAGLPAYYFIKESVNKWGGNHPKNVVYGDGEGLGNPDIKRAFLIALVAVFVLAAHLLWLRYRTHLLSARLQEALREMSEYDLLEDSR